MIDIHELVRDAGLDWHAGWTLDEDAENRYATLYRLIREAVVQELVEEATKRGWAMKNEDPFEDAVRGIAAAIRSGQ